MATEVFASTGQRWKTELSTPSPLEALSTSVAPHDGKALSKSTTGEDGQGKAEPVSEQAQASPEPPVVEVPVQLNKISDMLVTKPSVPVMRDCSYGGWFCELKVVEAVEDYLQFQGLERSLLELKRCLSATGVRPSLRLGSAGSLAKAPAPTLDEEFVGGVNGTSIVGCEFAVARAMRDFDLGQRDSLFSVWQHLIPAEAVRSPTGCALELRLRVHFCTAATRKALSAGAEELGPESEPDFSDLKAFLGAQPSAAPVDESSESLAPLYALPFVPRPHQNPALRFIFEEPWLQKLRTDLQAFLTAYASVRHAPTLRHLAGAMVMARCPRAAPPPASWHELLRIADLGLAAASQACQVQLQQKKPVQPGLAGQEPRGNLPQSHPEQLLAMVQPQGAKTMPDLLAQVAEARRRLAAVALRPDEAPPVTATQDPRTPAAGRALSVDTDGAQVGPNGAGVPVYQDRLWPMSREGPALAALRASSASSLGGSHSMNAARRLHSARSLESRARTATALLPVPPALDFGRMGQLLAGEGDKVFQEVPGKYEPTPPILAVLRAVLRRLALPDEPIRPRRSFLAAFSCFGALRTLAARLNEIVSDGDSALTEMSLAVMAVCACEVVGRREIEAAEAQKQPGCISALITVMSTQPVPTLVHMHCLAVLQRLSLRWQLQSKMIELGALDWVLKILQSVKKADSEFDGNGAGGWCRLGPGGGPEAPDFSIEFTSALLMNLTLRSAGRRRCAELGAYSVLVGLIEHPNPQVRTHVNGTLYTLLGVPSLRQEAIRQGAEATFRSALERVPPDNDLLKRQLEYLLLQLGRASNEAESDGEESDGDGVDAGLEGDADDGDNFLDEEELAAHFHLASTSGIGQGEGYSQAEIDANTEAAAAEAASAEEALRCFRAAPAVADAQQRRFHAFIARSCRNLMSPKRNSSSQQPATPLEQGPLNEVFQSQAPPALDLQQPLADSASQPPKEEPAQTRKESKTTAAPSKAPVQETQPPPADAEKPGAAAQATKPSPKQRPAPQAAQGSSTSASPNKRQVTSSSGMNSARSQDESSGGGAGRGGPKPPKGGQVPSPGGRGAGSGGRGRAAPAGASSPGLPALAEKGGGRGPGNSPGKDAKEHGTSATNMKARAKSEAPRRSKPEAAAEAAAAVDAAVSVGEGGNGWRRPKNAGQRSASLDTRTRPPPQDSAGRQALPAAASKGAATGSSLPQLPRIPSQRRGL